MSPLSHLNLTHSLVRLHRRTSGSNPDPSTAPNQVRSLFQNEHRFQPRFRNRQFSKKLRLTRSAIVLSMLQQCRRVLRLVDLVAPAVASFEFRPGLDQNRMSSSRRQLERQAQQSLAAVLPVRNQWEQGQEVWASLELVDRRNRSSSGTTEGQDCYQVKFAIKQSKLNSLT